MKQKLWNLSKAFITGFVVVAVVLLALNLAAPFIGFDYVIGWGETFSLERGAMPVVNASWLAPILVGILFAIVQLFDDYESSLAYLAKKMLKTKESKNFFTVLWHGVWGLAIGFVISMFLFAILVGTQGTHSIPFLLEVSAAGSSVTGTTTIISLSAILGLAYGAWKAKKRK